MAHFHYTAEPDEIVRAIAPPETPPPVMARIAQYLKDRAYRMTVNTQCVLAAISIHARNESGTAWPGISRLAQMARCHPNSVCRALRELKAANLITVMRDHPDHPEREWVYVVEGWETYWIDRADFHSEQPQNGAQKRLTEIRAPVTREPKTQELPKSDGNALHAKTEKIVEDADQPEVAAILIDLQCEPPYRRQLLRMQRWAVDGVKLWAKRAIAEARDTGAWIYCAMKYGWSFVSDRDKPRRQSASTSNADDTTTTPTPPPPDITSIRSRWKQLSTELKEAIKTWILKRHDEFSIIGRAITRNSGIDGRVWSEVGVAMTELCIE